MIRFAAMQMFRPLNRKLLRDIIGMWGQVIAVSLVVACGVAVFVMMNGTLASLQNTLAAYYDRYAMADVWAPARRAPLQTLDTLSKIEGVRSVEGRISAAGVLDMPLEAEPVKARIISVPDGKAPAINRLYMKAGQLPARGLEQVVVADDFAEAHRLRIGDKVSATLYGVRRELTVSGIALAPEFIYSIAPGEMIPNARRYAIMWMGYEALAHAYNMDGAFNEAVLLLGPTARVPDVLGRVDTILDSFGGVGAYHRDDQLSDEFLQSEFTTLGTLGGMLPPIFLGVAAFLLNMVITRIVEHEREQIGLMKAFGYTSNAIVWHYLRFAGVIVGLGVLAGCYMGYSMGGGMASIYQDFYKFPELKFAPGSLIYVKAAGFAVLAAVLGVLLAVRKTISLQPAVAMAPPAPTDYSKIGRIAANARWMDQGLRLIVRHIVRWPGRSAFTCLGVAMGMAIMIGAQSSRDAMNRMIDMQFELVSRQDLTVVFTEKQNPAVLHELAAIRGVLASEPFLAASATISYGHKSRHQGITGVMQNAQLNVLLDQTDRVVNPAPRGITLSASLADAIGADLGDTVHVRFREGERKEVSQLVQKIVPTYLGTPAYMDVSAMQEIMQEGDRISGAYLMVDTRWLDEIYSLLKDMPAVAAVSTNQTSRHSMKETMDETMGTMTFFNSVFASLIAIGVVFSGARISFYERQREIASLRVLGFTVAEVNAVLLGELAVLTFLALPLGAFIGYQLALTINTEMSSELFRVPTVVSNWSFAYAASMILIASILSAAVIAQQVKKLDLVIALKTRE
ncbi:MAG: FtsX-like permease family protein [Alphaproteobacteria bacterium]|nr:FtsX-like permease family protein [Alphaproteobacteria bacterium]